MVKLFPSRWVVLKDAKLNHSDVETGILVDVCNDEEKDDTVLKNLNQGNYYDYFRTTQDEVTVGLVGGIVI